MKFLLHQQNIVPNRILKILKKFNTYKQNFLSHSTHRMLLQAYSISSLYQTKQWNLYEENLSNGTLKAFTQKSKYHNLFLWVVAIQLIGYPYNIGHMIAVMAT